MLIRDPPADVHSNLQRRAAEAGQSLQRYVTNELSRIAQSPTMAEVLAPIAERSGGRVGFETAVDDQCRRQGELIVVDPVILASARKHQITDHDMLHAHRNPIRVFDLDELTMLVGPDTAGNVITIS